jgi:hypothetical protein
MSEFLERLTSGRTVLLIALALVLALRLSVPAERNRTAAAPALPPASAAQELAPLPAAPAALLR